MQHNPFIENIKTHSDFQIWLGKMDIKINSFLERFQHETGLKPDYTIEAMSLIENWLINKYPSLKQMKNAQSVEFIDGIARFVGETFRKYFGGDWGINLEYIDDLYYACPHIVEEKQNDKIAFGIIYPHVWVTTSIDRRTGMFITQRFEKILERLK